MDDEQPKTQDTASVEEGQERALADHADRTFAEFYLNAARKLPSSTFQLLKLSIGSIIWRLTVLTIASVGVAILVYWMVDKEESWIGEVTATLAFLLNFAVAIYVALQSAMASTLVGIIEHLGFGKIIFDLIFYFLLKREPELESLDEARAVTNKLDGLTPDELRLRMDGAATSLMETTSISKYIPSPIRWASNRVYKLTTWSVTKVVYAFAAKECSDGQQRISIAYIRDNLGANIDAAICGEARSTINQNIRAIFGFTAIVTLVVGGFIAVITR